MQLRKRNLPFVDHPPLTMAHRLSHVHHWFVAVTPPQSVVYLIYNIWLQVVYVGVTAAALANRLRKRMTDSPADVVCATLHKHMVKHNLGGWGILPLQCTLPLANTGPIKFCPTMCVCVCVCVGQLCCS